MSDSRKVAPFLWAPVNLIVLTSNGKIQVRLLENRGLVNTSFWYEPH